MPTRTIARPARKSASSSTTPATPPTAPPRASTRASARRATDPRAEEGRMGKILIVYASRTGETQAIAELIAEGARMAGRQVEVRNAKSVKTAADLAGY